MKALLVLACCALTAASTQAASSGPDVVVLPGGDSKARPEDCRAILVGPGINQPDPFPGYGGFVGWESPVRLKCGDWLVGFNAGYWHASPPTPWHYPAKALQEYLKLGLPAGIARTGGHHTPDAQSNAIRCIRLRVRPDYSGIDLLPAPNRGHVAPTP